MPPEDARPLSDGQRRTLVDWHRRTFVDIEPRPGRAGPRRLTRNEYRNTLSDLLGIPLRPGHLASYYNVDNGSIVEKLLAADPPGPSGFDNDASVLSLGAAEFARFLQIAVYLVEQLDSLPEARQALFDVASTGYPWTGLDPALAVMVQCNSPGWWCLEEKDRLLGELARETDVRKRKAIIDRIQVLFYEDVGGSSSATCSRCL